MCRFPLLLLAALCLPAQTPPLDRPPQDVDDSLRARITQFYDYHVQNKYRQCEQLIAEESKDDFYVLTKPQLQKFKINSIEYSDHFTKAKATIIGTMPALMPGVGTEIRDQPFASFWKQVDGVWMWYYNKSEKRDDGKEKREITIEELQSALKVDRQEINLTAGIPQTLKVTNTLPGSVSLSIDCVHMPLARTGITASFDRKDLKSNETATITLDVNPKTGTGWYLLRITASPTNQVLDIKVTVQR